MGINSTWTVPQGFGYIKRSFLGSTIGIAGSHGQGHVDSVSEAVPLFRLLGSLLRTSQAGYAAQVHAPDELRPPLTAKRPVSPKLSVG